MTENPGRLASRRLLSSSDGHRGYRHLPYWTVLEKLKGDFGA